MNAFAYRLPGQFKVISSKSDKLLDFNSIADGLEGFCISDFNGDFKGIIPKGEEISLSEFEEIANNSKADFIENFPLCSTSQELHQEGVNKIIEAISDGELTKCVLARVIVVEQKNSVETIFRNLCDKFKSAFIFLYYTPNTGLWMGATPETLLVRESNSLFTMALAGTRDASCSRDWDSKNLLEHEIVISFIEDKINEAGMEAMVEMTTEKQYGNVKHLMTPIQATCNSLEKSINLALSLSPTPALCGMPREASYRTIIKSENFDRECYGGFCGPIYRNGDFRFYVNLRSFKILNKQCAIYAGGGIVADSNAMDEWEETEKKASGIIDAIIN